uniref:Uncharacterized protein n=1 Tax=Opuntia streptacantha TaxID=393608 RepID=A0A7C8ZKY0_OPUST
MYERAISGSMLASSSWSWYEQASPSSSSVSSMSLLLVLNPCSNPFLPSLFPTEIIARNVPVSLTLRLTPKYPPTPPSRFNRKQTEKFSDAHYRAPKSSKTHQGFHTNRSRSKA